MENYEKQNALNDSELENVAGGKVRAIDTALQKCLDQQAYIGAARNRLDYTSSNLEISAENSASAESDFRDADMMRSAQMRMS